MREGGRKDIFERFLKLIGEDYWSMLDFEIEKLAEEFKLSPDRVTSMSMLNGKPLFKLDKSDRKKIIEQLVSRDKFASSFVAIVISIIALVISAVSILVAIFK